MSQTHEITRFIKDFRKGRVSRDEFYRQFRPCINYEDCRMVRWKGDFVKYGHITKRQLKHLSASSSICPDCVRSIRDKKIADAYHEYIMAGGE